MLPLLRNAMVFLTVLLSTACQTMPPPSSLVKLARLSPLEADPHSIRLAVRAPQDLNVRDGDITLTIAFNGETAQSSILEQFKADIVRSRSASSYPGLEKEGRAGEALTVAALTPEDATRMREIQNKIKLWRAAGIKGSGSFSVAATGCLLKQMSDEEMLLTIWLQTARDEPFFMITRNADIGKALDSQGKSVSQIAACT